MKIRIHWINTLCALGILTSLLAFPFANPCENSTTLCTTKTDIQTTDFYGLKIYLPN